MPGKIGDFPKNHVSFFRSEIGTVRLQEIPSQHFVPISNFTPAITCDLLRSLMYNPNIVQRLLNNIPMSPGRSWDSHLDTMKSYRLSAFLQPPEERRKYHRWVSRTLVVPTQVVTVAALAAAFVVTSSAFVAASGMQGRVANMFIEHTAAFGH